MRRLKKTTAAVLAAVLACSMLTACGKDKDNNTTTAGTTAGTTASSEGTTAEGTTAATEGTTAADAGNEDVGTITVMGVDWGYGPTSNSSMEQWWEEYLGVDFEVDWVSYQDYAQKLNTLLASGKQEDIPDVVQVYKTNNSFYYPVFAQAVDAGVFVNLDQYLYDEGLIANNEVMKEWPEQIWENTKYKGHSYILPRAITAIAPNSGIEVRYDLMKEYDMMDEPATMEELQTWLLELSEKSGLYALEFSSPDVLNSAAVQAYITAFTGQGPWGIDANGNFVYQPFAEGFTDFMDWMKVFYDAGAMDPEFIMNQSDVSKFKAGKSVSFLNAWYNWNQSEDLTTNKIFDKNTPDTYEAYCLMPVKGPKGYAVSIDSYGFGECIAINSKVSEAKLRKILEVFNKTGDEYMDVLLYGVEGLHFDWVDGSRISSDEQKNAKTEGYVGAWNQIFLKANLDQVAQKFCRDGAQKASQANIDRAYAIEDAVQAAVDEMKLTDPSLNLISETYNSNWSTLIADCNDMIARYIMGEIDMDAWNSYVDGIVNSSEYQAIISEFKTAAAAN